jgi:hypothetical protein
MINLIFFTFCSSCPSVTGDDVDSSSVAAVHDGTNSGGGLPGATLL